MNKKLRLQVEEMIRDYKNKRDEIAKMERDLEFIKNRIIMLLDKAHEKSYEYVDATFSKVPLKCSICERSEVKYDLDRARELLGSKKLKKIVDKTYGVADITKLIELSKTHGISPDELKSCLSVSEKVNNKKLDQLYDIGEVSAEEVQEFCQVSKTTRYITLK